MTVRQLITFLKKFDKDLPICYELCSEQCLLEEHLIVLEELQPPRPDGWVHDKRPDKPSIMYLVFPGN